MVGQWGSICPYSPQGHCPGLSSSLWRTLLTVRVWFNHTVHSVIKTTGVVFLITLGVRYWCYIFIYLEHWCYVQYIFSPVKPSLVVYTLMILLHITQYVLVYIEKHSVFSGYKYLLNTLCWSCYLNKSLLDNELYGNIQEAIDVTRLLPWGSPRKKCSLNVIF